MGVVKYCSRCGNIQAIQDVYKNDDNKCYACNKSLIEISGLTVRELSQGFFDKQKFFTEHNIHPVISEEDAKTIMDATNKNEDVLNAMIDLKQKDIIEYGIKLAQFKPAAEVVEAKQEEKLEQERQERIREMNTPKCPKCGSTNISTGARGWKITTGFLGAGKTVNRCASCGYTWKPGR